MARYTKIITATKPASLVSTVNTFLATLTNPTLHRVEVALADDQSQAGVGLVASIDYSDGGAALATPFLLMLLSNRLPSALETAVNAQYAANAAYFWMGARHVSLLSGDGRLGQYLAFLPYNVTGGASANWSPL